MRALRVKSENGERYAAALREAGYHATWMGPGTADTSLYGGCSDPGCCCQHESYWTPGAWGSIRTDASGTKAHEIWRSLSADRSA